MAVFPESDMSEINRGSPSPSGAVTPPERELAEPHPPYDITRINRGIIYGNSNSGNGIIQGPEKTSSVS